VRVLKLGVGPFSVDGLGRQGSDIFVADHKHFIRPGGEQIYSTFLAASVIRWSSSVEIMRASSPTCWGAWEQVLHTFSSGCGAERRNINLDHTAAVRPHVSSRQLARSRPPMNNKTAALFSFSPSPAAGIFRTAICAAHKSNTTRRWGSGSARDYSARARPGRPTTDCCTRRVCINNFPISACGIKSFVQSNKKRKEIHQKQYLFEKKILGGFPRYVC